MKHLYSLTLLCFICCPLFAQNMKITLQYNQKLVELNANKATFFDELYSDCREEKRSEGGKRLTLMLHPKQNVVLQSVDITLPFKAEAADKLFCNGWQSWSESREFAMTETIKPLRRIAKRYMQHMGDYAFNGNDGKAGHLHSWTYTYLRHRQNDSLSFIGSLADSTGFTRFNYNYATQTLSIHKDCAGLSLEHSFLVFDLLFLEGKANSVLDDYFKTFFKDNTNAVATNNPSPIAGWTSWYEHYTNISQAIINDNLKACKSVYEEGKAAGLDLPDYLFQIDDGWQQHTGDWLEVKTDKFPDGMTRLAANIHEQGFKAGLWLAPFIAESKSNLFKQHPDWFLHKDGQPIKVGNNPLWSGWFYALDIYKKEVQEYIYTVMATVTEKWRYDLVKLDFLYAACIQPPAGKTRGQVMHDAMELLRRACGKAKILGCGMPLAAGWGQVDYCRIGADVHLRWEHKLLRWLRHRERVSTKLALTNTLGRAHLDGRVWGNDPDVFLLRDKKQHLDEADKQMLFQLNALLGSVWFTSDNVSLYSAERRAQYLQGLELFKTAEINQYSLAPNGLWEITLTYKGKRQTLRGQLH